MAGEPGDYGQMGGVVIDSPIGRLRVEADATGVRAVRFDPEAMGAAPEAMLAAPEAMLAAAVAQVREYFTGARVAFDLPLVEPATASDFERAVWARLRRIPYGEQHTYGQVATDLGDPGAARAVGIACNRNPLPLLTPCHRVVGAGGKLVGFGGGLACKRWLLEHEARFALERAWRYDGS